MRTFEELNTTVNRRLFNILYKLDLSTSSEIKCSICPYNTGENKKHKNQKSWKRSTKRRNQYKSVIK